MRRVGSLTGLVVAAGFVVGAWLVAMAVGNRGTLREATILLALPALAAGAIGGHQLALTARRAESTVDWLAIILGLGVLALLIGAVATGIEMGIGSFFSEAGGTVDRVLGLLAYAALVALLGPFTVGPTLFPVTVAAALVWAIVMARLRPRVADAEAQA